MRAVLVTLLGTARASWDELANHHLDPACSSDEYKGDLGQMAAAADCLEAAQSRDANYAVWRGDGDKGCYICRLTARGDSTKWKYTTITNAVSFAKEGPPPGPPAPPPPGPVFDAGGLHVELWPKTFAVKSLNVSVPPAGTWGKANNFSFVPPDAPRYGCHHLGDITLRVQPGSHTDGSNWAIYSSASATGELAAATVNGTGLLAAHDLTPFLNATNSGQNPFFSQSPLTVVRSYEEVPNGSGLVLRFNITNSWMSAVRLGALGLSMPQTDKRTKDIEQSVWHDPHVGGDHGFVEWVRVVVDERTLLATPHRDKSAGLSSRFEAWRPVMEDSCAGGTTWEFTMRSEAWAREWARGTQLPYLWMSETLNKTGMWPNPKTPWPAWHGHDTVPVTDHDGFSQPWNEPSSQVLEAGETLSVAVRLQLAMQGPRTRDAALAEAGNAVLHASPGYVLAPDMTSAQLFVQHTAAVTSVSVSNSSVLQASQPSSSSGAVVVPLQASSRGRCRVSVLFDDGTTASAHFIVVPPFREQVQRLGHHWATDSWLPRNYPDPFGRSASVMPYDRENREIVLDDARAYDVGLSDDAGGGNPLGFASKVGLAPNQDEVDRLDAFINWTLYGVKPDTAKEPLKSLQIRYDEPGMEGQADGIRMTMYYYDNAAKPSKNWSGHFSYDYKEQDKCGAPGIEGGPNWCMSENNANATYRVFNFPHHTASYYNMYRVARNSNGIRTLKPWQWYLERAANTTLKFGSPSTGVMDGTIFREVLRSLHEEGGKWAVLAAQIESNMLQRAHGFAAQEYPYGSEFSFDTTGQEEVVVWLRYFANATNKWDEAAKRTVDHTLSHMRNSPTWAYHGGSRSWGDLGNNGKWMVSSGTGFETRGNMHYRSGLNQIPLIEWYRANPDDFLLLEVSMGALAGQMANIDESGAPSMMLHMLPHVLDFDPHSGDFGLGFFGHTLEVGAYFVQHPQFGPLCFLCNTKSEGNTTSLEPVDSYRQRVYLEPIGLYLQLDAGIFMTIEVNVLAKSLRIQFEEADSTFSTRRLRMTKEAMSRPGSNFHLTQPTGAVFAREAFEFPASENTAVINWDQVEQMIV